MPNQRWKEGKKEEEGWSQFHAPLSLKSSVTAAILRSVDVDDDDERGNKRWKI